MKSIFVFLFLLFFISSVNAQENSKTYHALNIICTKNLYVKKDSISIQITYFNSGNDTLLLPVDYFRFSETQELIFPETEMFCTLTTKMAWPDCCDYICNKIDLKRAGFEFVAPGDSITKEYFLDDLGCVNYNFEIGKTYKYYVKLNIDEKFKLFCTKVWVGEVQSDIGTITIK